MIALTTLIKSLSEFRKLLFSLIPKDEGPIGQQLSFSSCAKLCLVLVLVLVLMSRLGGPTLRVNCFFLFLFLFFFFFFFFFLHGVRLVVVVVVVVVGVVVGVKCRLL